MKTFIQFYAENDLKADIDNHFRFVSQYFQFEMLRELFFGILNGKEFTGEGFMFVKEKENGGENLFVYAFSERNGVIVRVCLCYFLMPETINDLFTNLRSMKMTQPSLYKAWEKAFELRKKVNAQSLTIEI